MARTRLSPLGEAFEFGLKFIAFLFALELADGVLALGLDEFGIRPREVVGLRGVVVAPLLVVWAMRPQTPAPCASCCPCFSSIAANGLGPCWRSFGCWAGLAPGCWAGAGPCTSGPVAWCMESPRISSWQAWWGPVGGPWPSRSLSSWSTAGWSMDFFHVRDRSRGKDTSPGRWWGESRRGAIGGVSGPRGCRLAALAPVESRTSGPKWSRKFVPIWTATCFHRTPVHQLVRTGLDTLGRSG